VRGSTDVHRGEVWSVALPMASGGREQTGQRPAVVLQDSGYGQASPLVLVAPVTSQVGALRYPGTVRIQPSSSNGLSVTSVAMVFQLRALDRSRFTKRLGELSAPEVSALLDELRRLTGQTS